MNLTEVINIGLAILTSLGGATLILFAFSSWLGKVWANRILEEERNKLAAELELIKTNNQNFINAVGVSNTLYIESQKAFAFERISATKLLWSELMGLKNNRSQAMVFLDILPFRKYNEIYKNSKLDTFDDQLSITGIAKVIERDVDKIRPFIDPKSYSYFWAYRALIGRISHYIKDIRSNGQPTKPWQEDESVTEVIKPIFNEMELAQFNEEKWSTHFLFGYIEEALSQHLRELLSGFEMSKESLDHSMKLLKAAENVREIENDEHD